MTILQMIDALYSQARKIAGLPKRDRREPAYLEKEKAETRLYALVRRVFRRQQTAMVAYLEAMHPERKKLVDLPPDTLDWEEDEQAELIRQLQEAAKSGIKLFGASVPLDFDYTLTNARAFKRAAEYAYDLIKDLDKTTRSTLQTVISAFVDTPGMTIGDVVRALPYNEERALMIAVTEITRAYSDASQEAAKDLKEKYPDVMVTKTWFTNNDDLVCDICGPLNEVEIEQDQKFEGGYDGPPGHPRCRCWLGHRTRIEGVIP